jgi:hypothetical protein
MYINVYKYEDCKYRFSRSGHCLFLNVVYVSTLYIFTPMYKLGTHLNGIIQ